MKILLWTFTKGIINNMSLLLDKSIIGDMNMQPWSILIEATIQEVKFKGVITVRHTNEEAAKRFACMTFINQLRRAGIWTYTDEIDEPYEVEGEGPKDKKTGKSTKKKETKYKKVSRYHAPYWDHVKAIKVIEYGSRDLTFPVEELEKAADYARGISAPKPKRKTAGAAALNGRKKKQSSIAKKEKQLEKKQKAEANKQSKDELLQVVEAYFTGSEAKIIKEATNELNQTYQRIRYALYQIKDNGYNGVKYDLIQTEINGSKAFRLKEVK